MKTVNLFDIADRSGFEKGKASRVTRNAEILYKFARHGSKGISKVNPVMIYSDAVISVVDAIVSFNGYQRAKEVTKQLEIELICIKNEYENIKKQCQIIFDNCKIEQQMKNLLINEELKKNREEFNNIKQIFEKSGQHLEFIKKIVEETRRNFANNDKVREMENKYWAALSARIDASLIIIGGD